MIIKKSNKPPIRKTSKSRWYLITIFEEYDRDLIPIEKFITQNPKKYEGNKIKFRIESINVK